MKISYFILSGLAGDAGHVSAAGVIHAQSGGDVHQHVWWGRQQTECHSCQENQTCCKETWHQTISSGCP